MTRALRAEVNAVLASLPAVRKPFLRRSLEADALFCTDLPLVASEETVQAAVRALEAIGWTVRRQAQLLQLGKLPDAPLSAETPVYGEAVALLSLLARHPGGGCPRETAFAILKARETHTAEKLFRSLHADWAVCLRNHEPLPEGLAPFIRMAAEEERPC